MYVITPKNKALRVGNTKFGRREDSHMSLVLVDVRAQYSTSKFDLETMLCFLADQDIKLEPK